ncbi:MAG: tyrosine-type recombinase/integrase [Leptolyngbyaceae bacterium]|nr:tyrosine-type recombinase/integrase [Leptolyngbyaceae bacterium]
MRNLKFVLHIKAKGRDYYYFRRDGLRIPLPGKPGQPEFHARYAELLDDTGKPRLLENQFGGLVASYLNSQEFKGLAAKTQQAYRGFFKALDKHIIETAPIHKITRRSVLEIRDRYADRPRMAQAVVRTLSLLYSYAIDREIVTENPCAGVRVKGNSARTELWTEEDEAMVTGCGDSQLVTAFMLGLYTGQRRTDVLAMRWDQYDGHRISLTQSKTRQRVWLPCPLPLKRHLDALPRTSTHILTDTTGKPFTETGVNSRWRRMRGRVGLREGLMFRDLRRTAACRLADAGCTVPEIASITGHSIAETQEIIDRYVIPTQQQASAAIAKLDAYRKPKV